MYYLPIAILSFAVFAVYSLVIIPFCYVKMVGHKFALMVVSPQGQGARSTLDRAGHAVLFLGVGPAILVFNWIVDLWWFILHLYKMDLEKTNNYKNSEATSSTIEINRRTYKKMLEYFSLKNE
jgi:uncharacterized membrane protein